MNDFNNKLLKKVEHFLKCDFERYTWLKLSKCELNLKKTIKKEHLFFSKNNENSKINVYKRADYLIFVIDLKNENSYFSKFKKKKNQKSIKFIFKINDIYNLFLIFDEYSELFFKKIMKAFYLNKINNSFIEKQFKDFFEIEYFRPWNRIYTKEHIDNLLNDFSFLENINNKFKLFLKNNKKEIDKILCFESMLTFKD